MPLVIQKRDQSLRGPVLLEMAFSSAGLISAFSLVAVSGQRAKCSDTTQMHNLSSHLSTLTSHMRCSMSVTLPFQATQQIQFDVLYLARGVSRDALRSIDVVGALDNKVVVLELSKFGGNNTGAAAEFEALVKFRGNRYLPQVFDYIPDAIAGSGQWTNQCSVLVVEACPTTVDEELHSIVQAPISVAACRYIEHIVREFLVWMVSQYVEDGMQFKDCHSGDIGLLMTFARFRAREAEQQEYNLQGDYAKTVVGLKHVDAESVADGKPWKMSGLNIELKKFVSCFTYEFVHTKAHVSWKRVCNLYSEHVLACISWHVNTEEHKRASLYMNALVQLRAAVATLFVNPVSPTMTGNVDVHTGVMPATEELFVPCWGSPPREHAIHSSSMAKQDGARAFEKQESKTDMLCPCGFDRAACGACARGWAQRNQHDSSQAYSATSDRLWQQKGVSVEDCVNAVSYTHLTLPTIYSV